MPVVMSYQDIGALAQLSHQAGYAQFRQQDQANTAALVANRQQQDTARMQNETARQQAEADRRLQGRLLNHQSAQQEAELGLRRQSLAQDNSQFYAGLASRERQTELGAQADIANRLIASQTQQQRDQRLHQNRLAEIEARGTRGADGMAISPEGVPSPTQSEREVTQFGNLIPYDTGNAVSGPDAVRRRDGAAETATGFSQLPTAELEAYISSKPSDQWTPYLRAIVQARQAVSGGNSGLGAVPEGNPFSQRDTTMPGALQGGGGFGLNGLSDAELNALANDPALMNQYFGDK